MEKEKQLEPKLLRRELFRVKCPRRIVAGDPYYFETEPPERLKKLVVDYIPPRSYEARLERLYQIFPTALCFHIF